MELKVYSSSVFIRKELNACPSIFALSCYPLRVVMLANLCPLLCFALRTGKQAVNLKKKAELPLQDLTISKQVGILTTKPQKQLRVQLFENL